jgi:hypothetical protein
MQVIKLQKMGVFINLYKKVYIHIALHSRYIKHPPYIKLWNTLATSSIITNQVINHLCLFV